MNMDPCASVSQHSSLQDRVFKDTGVLEPATVCDHFFATYYCICVMLSVRIPASVLQFTYSQLE